MESTEIESIKEKTDNEINTTSSRIENSEQKTEKPKHARKKLVQEYSKRGLDICGVCKRRYNLGDRIPRILVHCGHTFCTSCLIKFHHIDHIQDMVIPLLCQI